MSKLLTDVRSQQAWENFCRQIAEMDAEVLEPVWLGSKKPHKCRCVNGHECWPRPFSVQAKQGICRVCGHRVTSAKRSQRSWENFKGQITRLGGVVVEPRWLGMHTPHRCLCVKGHKCSPRPASILAKQGMCSVCSRRDSGSAQQNFYREISGLNAVVLETEWLGALKPHRCRCVRGHECWPRPNDVQQGHGICVVCGWWKQDVLYVVRNPITCWVKFGITSGDSRDRLRKHCRDGFTEISYLKEELPEGIAALVENKIKVALAMAGARPVRGDEYFNDENLVLIENEIYNWI